MKTKLSLVALVMAAAVPVQAQLFTPSTVGGAALGAVAGGVIGNNTGSRNHGTQGAVIGAVAGGLLGSAYARSRREPTPTYSGYTSYEPSYYYSSGPAYAPATYYETRAVARPSYTATTALLGGVAGAIIGHNNGRRAWQGAAIGAGSGYLLGRLSEPSRSRQVSSYTPYRYYRQLAVAPIQPVAEQPQQVTIINNYHGTAATPMSSANAIFGR